MCHIELFVDRESPLIRVVADATLVPLRTHVLSVQCVTLRLSVKQLFRLDGLSVGVCSDDALTEAASLIAETAATEDFNVAGFSSIAILFEGDLALFVRICRCAVVRRICLLKVKHDLICCGALGDISLFLFEGESREAVFPILRVFLQRCLIVLGVLIPAKLCSFLLGIHLHAFLCASISILNCLVPAIVRDLTLVILRAHVTILAILFTDRLKRPLLVLVTVMVLHAVGMLVASVIFFIADAHLLAVTTLALAGHGARATRIKHLFQICSIFAFCGLFP